MEIDLILCSIFIYHYLFIDWFFSGVNSFKMFLAYKGLFQLNDAEVCHKY